MDHFDRSEFRFGSAGTASEEDIRRAGLFEPSGAELGFLKERPLRLASDAPLISFAGAGAGKLTTVIAGNVLNGMRGVPALICDPRGEIAAISVDHLGRMGEPAYCWGPRSMHGLAMYSCNPLAFLTLDNPSFHLDCRDVMNGWIPPSGSSNGRYFELRAQDCLSAIATARVEQFGRTSMPDLYRVIMSIEGNPHAWADQIEFMLQSRFDHVRQTAAEMLTKQTDSPREFGSVMGEIYANIGFLHDEAVRASLEGGGFDLDCLIGDGPAHKVFLNIPAEHVAILSPVLRVFFTVTMILKGRAPQARKIMLVVDEAGQMGNFSELLRSYTYARGGGTRVWAFFQDVGQIERNFGRAAIQTFIGSAQVRQFFGVRDYETARLVSDMMGLSTLEYDDTLQQEEARRRKAQIIRDVMIGGDPFAAAQELRYQSMASTQPTKQARPVLTPDEILNLPESKQVLFISGLDLLPIVGDRKRYFDRRDLAGAYAGHPFHPPVDRVQIATRFGRRQARVCEIVPPDNIAHFPQFRGRAMRYVEGHLSR
ncbi:MAG: type IV secretory system conjugative DNA transfer family protein [Pseudomonadota bacterium]|nr:type IV secretory system conjugative DNA transfer family protein [Pseudomonadota bacterium]